MLVRDRATEVLDDERVRRRLGEALMIPSTNAADLALIRELADGRPG